MLKVYYHLTKPGIIYGNALTMAAGFFLAAKGHISWLLLISTLVGLSFVIASACVFNNIFDADIDAKMTRTQNRAMVKKIIPKNSAFIFGLILLLLGILGLNHPQNLLPLLTALLGFVVYVFFYTPLKRKTVHATLIGAISGATPPVVGYTSVVQRIDAGAIILFLILVFWQMPHFYAIAIRRQNDYAEADLPVLPIKKGVHAAKFQMLLYIIGFLVAAASLTYFKIAGYIYLSAASLLGLLWLRQAILGFQTADNTSWAKRVFLFSLIVLTLLSVSLSVGSTLP